MTVHTEKNLNIDNFINRLAEAIIKRIEGDDGEQGRLDYLTKPDHNKIKTMSDLSDSQVDSIAESDFLAQAFPSLAPLQSLTRNYAEWSPSKKGKRAEQVTATLINRETSIVPTVLNAPAAASKKEKKQQEKEAQKQ